MNDPIKLPLERIPAHFLLFSENEENDWLPGTLSIAKDGTMSGEIFQAKNTWLEKLLPSFGSNQESIDPVEFQASLQEPISRYAFIDGVTFHSSVFRTGYPPIGSVKMALPPFKFSAEKLSY
ncbi:hypothetical protein FAI40_07985 [Acetobacteraceae bacterium]|nr:hypothetical protein FAI40_07985 [Acetobacteraceae bacterium]